MRWIITLADAGRQDVPACIRLRKALKTLLRVFGLRCEAIRETDVIQSGTGPDAGSVPPGAGPADVEVF